MQRHCLYLISNICRPFTLKLNCSSESPELDESQWSSNWGYALFYCKSSWIQWKNSVCCIIFSSELQHLNIATLTPLWVSFRLKCAEPLWSLWRPLGDNHRQRECKYEAGSCLRVKLGCLWYMLMNHSVEGEVNISKRFLLQLSSQNAMLQRGGKKSPLQKDGKSSETFSLCYEYIVRTEMTYRL